jgi:hypothetical protein
MNEPDMREPDRPEAGNNKKSSEPEPTGPNLALLYGLVALALAVAIGLAVMIVLPFYHHARH